MVRISDTSTKGIKGPQHDANRVFFGTIESRTESVLLSYPLRSKEGVDFFLSGCLDKSSPEILWAILAELAVRDDLTDKADERLNPVVLPPFRLVFFLVSLPFLVDLPVDLISVFFL